jgi:hypothetical protein
MYKSPDSYFVEQIKRVLRESYVIRTRDVLVDEAVKYGSEQDPTLDQMITTSDVIPLNIEELLPEDIKTSEETS